MNCDSYFEIGSSHLVCQDYALTGTYRDMSYGIVSDGCSSAEYSELGAQILCHSTRYFLALYHDLFLKNGDIEGRGGYFQAMADLLGNSIRTRADEIRKLYPISRDSLQATLLIALVIKGNALIFAWGDGVIIKSVGGHLKVDEIDFPLTNAPVYLTTDKAAYDAKFGPDQLEKKINRYESGRVQEISRDYDKPYMDIFPVNPGDLIAIATDGLSQYQDENKKPVPLELIIPQVLDYPNNNGQFVKRTMNFLKRDLARKNWSHADDIGVATIIA